MVRKFVRRRSPFTGRQAYKHIVTSGVQGTFDATQTTVDLIRGVDNPVITNTEQVQTQAKVMGFYFELRYAFALIPTGQKQNDLHWALYFSPQGLISGATIAPIDTGFSQAKTYIIKQGTLSIDWNSMNTQAVTGYVPIPPKYQRFMLGDRLRLVFQSAKSSGSSLEYMNVKIVYKELRG